MYDPAREKLRPGDTVTWRWTLSDGVIRYTRRAPKRMLTETLHRHGTFQVPAGSFFQVNISVAALLADRVIRLVSDAAPEELLELYCGVGLFSVLAAKHCPSLTCFGMELDPYAIQAACRNAKFHGVASRCRFESGDASHFTGITNPRRGMVLLDPPRTGLSPEGTSRLRDLAPRWILYISCAPDTLCRDLARLGAGSEYRVCSSGLLDMFPGTPHFESVTLLEHVGKEPR